MARIKQWTAKVISRIDWAANQIENHESRMTSALEQMQRASARARVQLSRVQKDGKRLESDLNDRQQEARVWRERALRLGREEDPAEKARAVECLRRSRLAAKAAEILSQRKNEHERNEERLRQDILKADEQISALRDQRNLLRTRQSRAEAMTSLQDALGSGSLGIDDLVDRWETRIVELEGTSGASDLTGNLSADGFEDAFLASEEQATLEAELEMLLAEEES
jgi:phage shock protein A